MLPRTCLFFIYFFQPKNSRFAALLGAFTFETFNVLVHHQSLSCFVLSNYDYYCYYSVSVCVCVFCVFFPFILDINGRISRGHTGGRSHRIFHPPYLFCGVCVFSSHSLWTSGSLDVPAGVTQEEGGHTGFLIHLLSAVRALIFLARRIQPFLSLVDCEEVEFGVLTI